MDVLRVWITITYSKQMWVTTGVTTTMALGRANVVSTPAVARRGPWAGDRSPGAAGGGNDVTGR